MSNYWDNLMQTDEGAANYMNSYGEGPGFDTRMLIGEFINDGESVLDVGCGPGWNLDHFMKYGPRFDDYKGLDYSERFVKIANQRHPDFFEVGDVRDIKEPDKSWDVVLLQDVLEHTNGYKKPIREALRVARKRIIISFWHLEGNEGTEHINDDKDDGWGAWYDKLKWEDYLESLGYEWWHTELEPVGKTHKWDFYFIEVSNGKRA